MREARGKGQGGKEARVRAARRQEARGKEAGVKEASAEEARGREARGKAHLLLCAHLQRAFDDGIRKEAAAAPVRARALLGEREGAEDVYAA